MLLSQNGTKWVKPPCLEVSPTLRHTCHNASSVCDQVKRMALHPPVRILVIDDEPSIVHGLAQLLRREDYHVATAANGRHALAELQVQPYDVILSDLHMPELDGQAFYALLRQQYPAMCQRIIFVTGDTLNVESTAFLAQCGQPYLYKPCTAAEVREVIQQQLGHATSAETGAPGAGGTDRGASMPGRHGTTGKL
jgi:CheY-like chemotaxis protein